MGASTDLTVTPRPIYHADGRKSPDCYTYPAAAARQPDRPAGRVPAVPVLGPDGEHQVHQVDRRRGQDRARQRAARPAARLPAAPRLRPPALRARARPRRVQGGAASSTRSLGDLIDHARARGDQVVVLSEYGITEARRPVEINRALRRAGLLNVYTQAGMEYLDPWTSRAFAVADHQIAHVYVADPADLPARARGDRRARRRGRGPRGRVAGRRRPRPRALGRARRPGRARRLVHLPLLARQRPRPGLRPPGRDPPQAGLRPRRAVLRPGRREGRQAPRRPRARRARRRACAT